MKYIAPFVLIFFLQPCNSQGLEEYYDDLWENRFDLELANYSRTHAQMKPELSRYNWPEDTAPDYRYGYGYFAFNFNSTYKTAYSGGFYYEWDWRCFSDWLSWANVIVADVVRDDKTKSKMLLNASVSNSWLGFHHMGFNILGDDSHVLRTGLTVADYTFHLSSSGDRYYAKENGVYYTLGPCLNYDVLLTDGLMLSLLGTASVYTFGAKYRPYIDDPNHPQIAQEREFHWGGRSDGIKNPMFYFFNAEIAFGSIYLRAEYWRTTRNTDTEKMKRLTFVLGARMPTS